MASPGKRSGGPPVVLPAPRLVVAFGPAAGTGRAGRVEAPARLLRLWALLNAGGEELRVQDLPAPARARLQRLLTAVSGELSRCLSPELAAELRELSGSWPAVPGPAELRVEYAALRGWLSGLVIAMLDQMQAGSLAGQQDRTDEEGEPMGAVVKDVITDGVGRSSSRQCGMPEESLRSVTGWTTPAASTAAASAADPAGSRADDPPA